MLQVMERSEKACTASVPAVGSTLQRQVVDYGKPMLGICLGMGDVGELSEENGFNHGLDFIPGRSASQPARMFTTHSACQWNK